MRVLLLNASHEPLHLVSTRRAVGLLMDGKAELLEAGPTPLRSATIEMARPAVIRLSRYRAVPYRASIPVTSRAVLARDRHHCGYCGQGADTVDHVIPRSRPGGRHVWENVVAACRRCNQKKGDRLLSELGWTLMTTPKRPVGTTARLLLQIELPDPLWEPYLAGVA